MSPADASLNAATAVASWIVARSGTVTVPVEIDGVNVNIGPVYVTPAFSWVIANASESDAAVWSPSPAQLVTTLRFAGAWSIFRVVCATPLAFVTAVISCDPMTNFTVLPSSGVEPRLSVAVSCATSLYCFVTSPEYTIVVSAFVIVSVPLGPLDERVVLRGERAGRARDRVRVDADARPCRGRDRAVGVARDVGRRGGRGLTVLEAGQRVRQRRARAEGHRLALGVHRERRLRDVRGRRERREARL